MKTLAEMVTEMAEGEVAQLHGAGNPDADIQAYLSVIDRKTAALMAWCAALGDSAADGASGPLSDYGRALGRAFQIADDILDCVVDESTAGKSVGHDLVEGKVTLPTLLACEADPRVRDALRSHMTETGMSPENARDIMDRVRDAGGVHRAKTEALGYAAKAIEALKPLDASPHREALEALAHLSVERVS